MPIPSADAITALVMADLDSIPRNASETDAREAAILAIVTHIRTAVLAATLTVPADGIISPGGMSPAPCTGASITGVLT